MPMLLKVTIIIFALIALNFLLLKFSVNKTVKISKLSKKPVVLNPETTIKFEDEPLAPTGS